MRSLCCQRSVYLISVSLIRATLHDFLQRNCLRSLSSSTFFLFFLPLWLSVLYLLCLFSIFPINILLFLSPALVSCPPGATMWQGKMGWSRARQVNRLKSAGEAWRFIRCVCTGRWARKCVCVFACSNLAPVANHMFPKSLPLLQSSSPLSVVTSCHVLISLPYFFLSQTEVLLYSLSFTCIFVAFQSF